MKRRINISLEEDTASAIKELAEQSHKNVSQWITDKVWEEYSVKHSVSGSILAYNENGDLSEFQVESRIVTCPKCHKRYRQTIEEQVPGFRSLDYDICPYCNAENGKSSEYEYTNRKID